MAGDRSSRDETWALAVVFGLASVPWTYAFVAGLHIPLWPSFIASATFYAAGGGLQGVNYPTLLPRRIRASVLEGGL